MDFMHMFGIYDTDVNLNMAKTSYNMKLSPQQSVCLSVIKYALTKRK